MMTIFKRQDATLTVRSNTRLLMLRRHYLQKGTGRKLVVYCRLMCVHIVLQRSLLKDLFVSTFFDNTRMLTLKLFAHQRNATSTSVWLYLTSAQLVPRYSQVNMFFDATLDGCTKMWMFSLCVLQR